MITARPDGKHLAVKRLLIPALATAVLIAAPASAAWAVRIFGATNPGNQLGTAQGLLDLGNDIAGNDIGDTLHFELEEAGPVVFIFSAECAVDGNAQQWVSIALLANGTALGQSDGDQDTFCSGDSFAGFNDSWVMASMTVPVELNAGVYDLQVQVTAAGGSIGWWIGDTGLTVIVQKR